MGEETTLEINTLDSEEGLFDDYVAEETTETTEPETTEEESTETSGESPEETVSEEPYGLKVKFNGEEKVLNEEDARTLAQKGMNYDRFYEPLEKLARMNNMSVGDYVNHLNDTQTQYEVSKEMDSLREDPKYADLDDEILEEIASSRVKEIMGERDKYYADQAKEQADAQQQQARREVDKFLEEYPEFRDKGPEVLDPKVFEIVKQGYTLLEAYNKFQRENPPTPEAKASKLNEANKKKSLGNTSTSGSDDGDSFMSGFNSY